MSVGTTTLINPAGIFTINVEVSRVNYSECTLMSWRKMLSDLNESQLSQF